jgi:anti-sigma factor RsiW
MNDPVENRMRELAWRRPLTDAEKAELQAWLATHPETRADWEAELQLAGLMNRLPDVPVPSNFTARVLQAAERSLAKPASDVSARRFWWVHTFIPRAATVAVLVMGCGLFVHQHHVTKKREAIAQGLAAMSDVDSLQNFEAIRRIPEAPAPDTELIALMQ